MINKLFFLLSFFLMMNCISRNGTKYKGLSFEEKIYPKIDKIFNIKTISCGTNLNRTINDPPIKKIDNFYFSFDSQRKFNIAQTRELLIECINYILSIINADEDIKDYLENYPFSSKNLTIHINFYDRFNQRNTDGNVTYCYLFENEIHYAILNKELFADKKHKETYQEALKIIQASND